MADRKTRRVSSSLILFVTCILLGAALDKGHAQLVVPYVNKPVYPLPGQWNPTGGMYGSPTQGMPFGNGLWGTPFSGGPPVAQPGGLSYPLARAGAIAPPAFSNPPATKSTSDGAALVKNAFDKLIFSRLTQRLPVLTTGDGKTSNIIPGLSSDWLVTTVPTATASSIDSTEPNFLGLSTARTRRNRTMPYLRKTTDAFSDLHD